MTQGEDIHALFRGKKVFLTGHTGFKGSWLLCMLKQFGAVVKGYSLSSRSNSLFSLIEGESLCISEIGDIRDSEKLKNSILEFSPDFIFHLAAQPLVLDSYEDPRYTFDVNVMGSVNVLEGFRQLSGKCVLVAITTDKVYKNKESYYPYRETDELGGHDPYSASKAAMEVVLDSYFNSFIRSQVDQYGKGMVICRAGNVIGGGDYSDNRIIPDIIRALETNETLQIRNPNSVRPWQHVLDALNGYLYAAYNAWYNPVDFSKAYNFGPDANEMITVGDLVKVALTELAKETYPVEYAVLEGKKETSRLLLDSYLAKQELGWVPVWNGVEAIEQTVRWYKEMKSDNALLLCNNHINAFWKI